MTKYKKEEHTDYYILKAIENDASISQRGLSSQMRINVASVNFALKHLIRKGLVRMIGANPRRIKYYITPSGLKEKTSMAYRFFGRNFHFYKEVRNDIEIRIRSATDGSKNRVAIYGVNELAEITYMVIMVMRLEFVGFFIEDSKITGKEWLGNKVQGLDALNGDHPCLLLLTDKINNPTIYHDNLENIKTLNLLNYPHND